MADWIPKAMQRLLELSRLGDNWDSYGGLPVQPLALGYAAQLLATMPSNASEPAMGSAGDGGVGFSWDIPDLDIDLGAPHANGAFAVGVIGGKSDEEGAYEEFTAMTLADLCKRLSEIFGDG